MIRFYQQWTAHHVANDIASRIAEQYAYPKTDPAWGFAKSCYVICKGSGAGERDSGVAKFIGWG